MKSEVSKDPNNGVLGPKYYNILGKDEGSKQDFGGLDSHKP